MHKLLETKKSLKELKSTERLYHDPKPHKITTPTYIITNAIFISEVTGSQHFQYNYQLLCDTTQEHDTYILNLTVQQGYTDIRKEVLQDINKHIQEYISSKTSTPQNFSHIEFTAEISPKKETGWENWSICTQHFTITTTTIVEMIKILDAIRQINPLLKADIVGAIDNYKEAEK